MAAEKKNPRSRAWCFTLQVDNFDNIKNEEAMSPITLQASYIHWQGEVGQGGKKHLQGCFYFQNPKTFNGVKRLQKEAHLEVARNFDASIAYCHKEETRVKGTAFTAGQPPAQGKK